MTFHKRSILAARLAFVRLLARAAADRPTE